MAGAGRPAPQRARRGPGAQPDAGGAPARTRQPRPQADRQPGGGRSVQPRQRDLSREAHGLGREVARPPGPVHGDALGGPPQPRAPSLLRSAVRGGEGEEGGPDGLHAQAPRHPQQQCSSTAPYGTRRTRARGKRPPNPIDMQDSCSPEDGGGLGWGLTRDSAYSVIPAKAGIPQPDGPLREPYEKSQLRFDRMILRCDSNGSTGSPSASM